MTIRVVGLGNAGRGDDGAGCRAVALVRSRAPAGVEAVDLGTRVSALLESFAGAEAVVLIDAMRTGARPGTVRRLDAARETLPVRPRASTHGIGVSEAVELGRALGLLPARLVLIAVEGRSFEPGAPMSPAVERATERAAALALREAGHRPARRWTRDQGVGVRSGAAPSCTMRPPKIV